MTDDAVLSVGIEDNLTGVLQKMATQARAFGASIGATEKAVDKSVRGITKSIGDLAGAGSIAPKAGQLQQATSQLAKYRAEMERLNYAANTRTTASGRQQSVATGRLVSQSDIRAYEDAASKAQRYEGVIARLSATEAAAGAARSKYAYQTDAAYAAQRRLFNNVDTSKIDRSSATLQKVYSQMWGARSQLKELWPPDMLKGPGEFIEAMEKMPASARYALYDISRTAAVAGAAMVALGAGSIGAAASFERSWADVQRTVFGTGEVTSQVSELRSEILAMSKELPVAFSDLTQIASVGGQMGIGASGIAQYTETIAKLTATTNLTADAASFALGRFKAFFAEASDPSLAVTDATFSNLASSILKVGVNSVATESGIVNVSTQISSMGQYAGLTADQVIGLAGALSSVGVAPELSRGVITRLFTNIGDAVAAGGTKLEAFAQLAGTSADDFASAWQTDRFSDVFTNMIFGLGELQRNTGTAVSTLHELGVTSVRDVPVLLRLANAAGEAGTAGSLLAQTMEDARVGWRENSELAMQYNIIAQTLAERLKVLGNNFMALFAAIGGSGVGPAKVLVDTLINITRGVSAMIESPIGQWVGGVITVFGLLTGALLLATAGAARFAGASQSVIQGLSQMGISAAVATPLVRGLGIALAGLGIVGAIAAVVGLFVGMAQSAEASSGAVQNTAGALAALRADSDRATSGFTTITARAEESDKKMSDAEVAAARLATAMGDLEPAAKQGADGVEEVTRASFEFGEASRDFVKNAILMDESMQELARGNYDLSSVGDGLDVVVKSTGYSMDKLIELYASGGRDAAEAYLEGLTGVDTHSKWSGGVAGATDQVALAQNALLDIVGKQTDGLIEQGKIALIAGESMRTLGEDTQYATEVTEEFAVANEDALKKFADGLSKFVSTGQLIDFTQQFVEAEKLKGDEAKEASAKAKQAWSDYYGGTKFKLSDYMSVFEQAANVQESHLSNLRALAARGVPDTIIQDLAAMGPDAVTLVQAMVDGSKEELDRYVELYGETGYNAMVALAAQQLSAQTIVNNAAKTLSAEQLNTFSADLQKGTPLTDALEKWQLDAEGNPLKADVKTEMDASAERIKLQNQLGNGISIPVTPYLTKSNVGIIQGGSGNTAQFQLRYTGGFTGRGHWLKPVGAVHAGEYVHPKRDVDQNTGRPKPEALMRMLQGGRPARPTVSAPGYANGGFVSGLPGMDMAALVQAFARSVDPRVILDGRDITDSVGRVNRRDYWEGRG